MKIFTKKIAAIMLGVMMGFAGFASGPFQGTIKFTKTIGPVTANYVYYVKGDLVRVEELGENGEIQGIMIVDTKANTVKALSPERQMFIDVPNKRPARETDVYVQKTNKTQEINGYQCTQVKVTGKDDGREVTFWVADDDFDFLVPMLETLNRKDKLAVYFMNVPDIDGMFPMKGVEKKTDGVELTNLQVNEVEKGELDDSLFEIPAEYTKFERE
ncbi:DUF4412 domain-containing protein [Cryomorphaceae bacterium 1068]|nr:DUF4412 domain-containing protein [Cryomorphaceae bacterium 1068]